MKKNLIIRSLIGAPIGLTISIIITIIISLFTGNGDYYPAPHELIELCGNPINAVLIQTVCSFLYGAAFGGASVIWDIEKLNLLKQTLLHFSVISVASFPMAFFMYWIPHHIYGALCYIGIFVAVYVIIWTAMYLSIKAKIKKLNNELNNNNTNDTDNGKE